MKKWISSLIRTNRKKMYWTYLKSKNTHYFRDVKKDEKKVIVALAADYSNLGDVAITHAQEEFLKEVYPGYRVVDFPISQTFTQMKELESLCTPDDIITIVGGGNTGDAYDSTEYARQFIIHKFSKNKIVSFPQTIDFSDAKKGQSLLKTAVKVYSKHPNLTLIAREENSYQMYKEHFTKNTILLYPDVVLYLDKSKPKLNRKGITLTLRTDKEKNITRDHQKEMISELEKEYGKVTFYDTDIKKKPLDMKTRSNELQKIWNVFKGSKVVVTDRLHGMIFCVITETPCVAINNSNRKVSRVYKKWLTDSNYIKMINEFDVAVILSSVHELSQLEEKAIHRTDLTEVFNEMKRDIK